VAWPSFPFEGQLRTKRLEPAVAEEPPREGEDPSTCAACSAPDDAYIWISDRWRVRAMDRPSGLPAALILESRSHLDLGDLTNLLAAELGVMTVRLERAIRSLDGVERVHVNRWGDSAAHLHLWFLARPTGQLQLRGPFLSLWDDILEPIPEQDWHENLAHIAAWLADFGGRAIAEPPRIEWHTPSSFGEVDASEPTFLETSDAGQLDDVAGDDIESATASEVEVASSETAEISADQIEVAQIADERAEVAQPAYEIPAQARPLHDADGLDGDGWLLSAEEIEESDILTR
jgi:hypothetical protein